MNENQVPLDIAASHYADAYRRGREAGVIDTQIKLIQALQQEKDTAQLSSPVSFGIGYAIKVLQNLK